MIYTQIQSPITGVAGQLQPIAVLFTLPEDVLPQVSARLRRAEGVPVEAWNRDNRKKLGTGRLTAVDNRIDQTTGMAKLKAVFDNNDGALFPNQFVNVRLIASGR